MTEQQQNQSNGQIVQDDDGIPQEVKDLVSLAGSFEEQVQRLRETKRDLVSRCRENKLNLADVVGDIFDELINMNAQLVASTKMCASGVDASFQFTEAVFPDEDEDDEDEDEPQSFITKVDANLIGAALSRARMALMMVDAPDATLENLREALKDQNVTQDVDAAMTRLTQIEEGAQQTESN